MTTASTRPLPVSDAQSAAFWEAAAAHVLTLARCSACGMFVHPPDIVCPHCGTTSPNVVFSPVSGGGVVRSWTVMRQSFLPGFDDDLPFVLVDVELDEQSELRLIGRLLDGVAAPVRAGARVSVAWEDLRPGVAVPAFRLEAGDG